MPTLLYYKKKWILTILDDYSSFATIATLHKKSDASQALQSFIALMQRKLNSKVITIRSDRGGEFTSNELTQFLQKEGIERQFSAPHLHQQNGRAERLNRTLTEKAECLRLHASCPHTWWEFAFDTATHIYIITHH